MNYRDKIHQLVFEVSDSLDRYVETQDRVFKESASFISFIKNLFGVGIPVEDLLSWAKALEGEWAQLSRKAEALEIDYSSYMSESEASYVYILKRYTHSVGCAVALLIDRQRIAVGIKRGGDSRPTFNDLQQVEAKYQEAVRQYVKVGVELNANAYRVAPWPQR